MLRRVITWIGAVVLVASVGLWLASLCRIIWQDPDRKGTLTLWGGLMSISNMGSYAGPGWTCYGFEAGPVRWWPHSDYGFIKTYGPHADGSFWWTVTVPLWMPAAAGLASVLGTTLPGRRVRRWRRQGRCVGCGYERAGLAADAPCPECGGITH